MDDLEYNHLTEGDTINMRESDYEFVGVVTSNGTEYPVFVNQGTTQQDKWLYTIKDGKITSLHDSQGNFITQAKLGSTVNISEFGDASGTINRGGEFDLNSRMILTTTCSENLKNGDTATFSGSDYIYLGSLKKENSDDNGPYEIKIFKDPATDYIVYFENGKKINLTHYQRYPGEPGAYENLKNFTIENSSVIYVDVGDVTNHELTNYTFDASTEYSLRDNNIVVVSNPVASNPGLAIANNEYDVVLDSDVTMNELSVFMQQKATKINNIITSIYGHITSMNTDGSWSGESYNAFKTSSDNYKKQLRELTTILKGFSKLFEDTADDIDTLSKDIFSKINMD